ALRVREREAALHRRRARGHRGVGARPEDRRARSSDDHRRPDARPDVSGSQPEESPRGHDHARGGPGEGQADHPDRESWMSLESPLEVYETLPIVPLRDVVVFPHMMMPFVIGRPSSTRALEHALLKDKRIFLAAQHDASVDDPRPEDIYTMGCVANVVQSLKLPDSNIKVLVEGVDRARAVEWKEDKGFYRVVVKVLPKQREASSDAESTMSRVVSL